MINILGTIKDYLVGLGFRVDNSEFNQAVRAMSTFENAIRRMSSNSSSNLNQTMRVINNFRNEIGRMSNNSNSNVNQTIEAMNNLERRINRISDRTRFNLAPAIGIVSTAILAADTAIATLLTSLAKTDMEMEKFARLMWTSKSNAMAFKSSLNAMGAQMEDLYLSPELMNTFLKLRSQANSMEAPSEYGSQMKYLRTIIFEFQRLKLEATYSLQWIGMYLMKYLGKPLENFRTAFQKLNDNIEKDMPKWTKNVAMVLSWVVRLSEAFLKLPDGVKLFVLALTNWKLIASAMKSPITWMIAGITALLLLLDDYQTYKEGGDSLFEDFWGGDTFTNLTTGVSELGTSLDKLKTAFLNLITSEGFKTFAKFIVDVGLTALTNLTKAITNLFESITALLKGDYKTALVELGNFLRSLFGMENIDASDMSWKDGGDSHSAGWSNSVGDKWMDMENAVAGFFTDSWKNYGAGKYLNSSGNTYNATFNVTAPDAQTAANSVESKMKYWIRGLQGGY